jgi:hypothetical protein
MKKHSVTIALMVYSVAALVSCGGPARQLKEAEAQNTEQAYLQVVRDYPGSPEAGQAQVRIEQLALESARKKGTEEALEAFLKRFPASSRSQSAESELEQMMSGRVETSGNPESYRNYLQRFPSTPFAATARQRLAELESKQDLEDLYGKLAAFLNGDESKNVLASVCGSEFVPWGRQHHEASMTYPGASAVAQIESKTGRLRVLFVTGETQGSVTVARVTGADFSPGCRLALQSGRNYEFRNGKWAPLSAAK